jgi:hypothetical protein
MSFLRAAFVSFALVAAAMAQEEKDKSLSIPKESPFKQRGGPAVTVAAASETIDFAGVNAVGKRTDLRFYDKTTKKGYWIAEGETVEGINVLKYDARREQVVVKINGVEKTLTLRKGAGPLNAPAAVAPQHTGFNIPAQPAAVVQKIQPPPPPSLTPAVEQPAVPAPLPVNKPEAPATPETQQKQETEARMLVSDLLEIGMAQRKAYEEAQRKASEGATTGQPPAIQAPPPSQPQPDKPNGN